MSRSEETIYRQWLMLTKIPRYPRKTTVPEIRNILLGEGYSVDTRTIQRDLNKLSISFPLSNDTEGRKNYWFWIKEAAIQDLPGMEPVTALAFDMAESYLTPLLPQATLDLLQPYFERAKFVLNEKSESSLRTWPDKIKVIERGVVLQKPTIKPDVQQTIYQALLEEKPLQAKYLPRDSKQAKEYLMHPLGIVSRMGVIYLICTLWDYDDKKQFALHRFESVDISNEPFKEQHGFSLQHYTETEHQFAYPIQPEPIYLKVLFDGATANHLSETPLSTDQKLTPLSKGKVLLEANVIETLELRWWLQAFGDNVEVLEPRSMRDKFKELSLKLASIYN